MGESERERGERLAAYARWAEIECRQAIARHAAVMRAGRGTALTVKPGIAARIVEEELRAQQNKAAESFKEVK